MTEQAAQFEIPYALLCGMVSHFYGDRLQSIALYGESLPRMLSDEVFGYTSGADRDAPVLHVLIIARTLPIGGGNRLMEFDMIRQQLPDWFRPIVRPVFYTGEELASGRPVFLQDDAPVAILRDDGTLHAALGLGPGQKPPRPLPQGPAPRRRRRRG